MAAYDDDGFPDDDEFDEYNPHPYSGGYDIAATYGAPRPPSAATCYPVATAPQPSWPSSSSLPQPSKPSSPAPAPARQAPSPSPAPPPAEPHYWPEPYDWGDAPQYAAPEVFRRWPYYAGPQRHTACCGRDLWRQCMRGLDYLFGHADGYGERRIGADCHGVPVYANRKGGVEGAVVVVEVTKPVTETVHWHYIQGQETETEQSNNRLSWYGSAREQEGTYASAEPTTYASYASAEPTTYASYPSAYTSYDRSYGQPYGYQGVSDEPSWFSNQTYGYEEAYKDQDSTYQDYWSYDSYKVSSQPTICYNQHFGEQPLHIHVEPPETVSSHKLEYYENFSTYANENDTDYLEGLRNSYDIQPYSYTPCDQLEPYRPSWSQNLEYYQACTEGVSSDYDNYTMASGESWDMSSLFATPFYPQETQIYEHSCGDDNV